MAEKAASTYWFMRMREGKDGEDFTKRMWERDLVGVLWGTWKIEHVLDGSSQEVNPEKLTELKIQEICPQPDELNFTERSLQHPRKLLLGSASGTHVVPGDKVVVVFDEALHIGTFGDVYKSTPNLIGRKFGEHFKCRRITGEKKTFLLSELPGSYRLVSSAARRALQRVRVYQPLVELLDRCATATDVRRTLSEMPVDDFLAMMSDKQWEVLCSEYLRAEIGFRSLLLAIGGTLKGIDLYGVNRNKKRILVQCKNSSNCWNLRDVAGWVSSTRADPEDSLYFFNRGGFSGSGIKGLECNVRSGQDVAKWLASDPEYQQDLRTR